MFGSRGKEWAALGYGGKRSVADPSNRSWAGGTDRALGGGTGVA